MEGINETMARTVQQTDPHALKQMIVEMLKEAGEVMGGKLDQDKINFTGNWLFKWLNERFNYLPMHHVRAAISFGAMGERGGTSILTPRNINIWMREQANIHQEQVTKMISHDDENKRNEYFNANKAEWQVAAAVRIKVGWLGDGMITSAEYDSFSAKKIYDLLKSGRTEKTIHPKEVVPNWELHRSDLLNSPTI